MGAQKQQQQQIEKCSELTQTDIREYWKQMVVKPH